MNDLSRHASRLSTLAPSCGPVRLIGVDGHAGSGKSTLASLLSAALGDAPVLRLDDLATHEELFAWVDRLREQVIGPLSRGESARYAPYDWTARHFGPPRTLEPAPVVLIEGVGAGRRALRPYLARLWWMELGPAASWSGAGAGTGPRFRRSGTGGPRPSKNISPSIPRVPTRMLWYASCLWGTSGWRDPARQQERTIPSPTVILPRRRTEQSEIGPEVPQLCLTRGRYRSYVLNVRLFGAPTDTKPPVVPP